MGLIISKKIIEQYGGELDFNSEFMNGSTFIFSMNIELQDNTQMSTVLYQNDSNLGDASPNFNVTNRTGNNYVGF